MAQTVHCCAAKGEVFVSDPSTYWLNLMNISLGVITLVCCAAVAFGIVQELATRRKKASAMSKLDTEVADLVASYDGHAFNVPGLGVTMADGGEELRKKEER
jgi:hypothetical protein